MMLLLDPGGVALTLDVDAGDREDRVDGPASSTSGPTLDELLSETWDGLLATAPVSCPVCEAPMSPRWSAGAGVVGGRCGSCGSELA